MNKKTIWALAIGVGMFACSVAQEQTVVIQAVLAPQLKLYSAPETQSAPVKILEKSLIALPIRVQEKQGPFARIQFGPQAYWVKSSDVRFSPPISVATCADPTSQQAANSNTQVAGARGAGNDCR
jgi:hypothetical protein